MTREELSQLNDSIASLHENGDVFSYDIEQSRRIKFPRGFLRTFNTFRESFEFIEDDNLKDKIANHMLHRDTLHWVWLKTDIIANAKNMIVKFQLINLGTILEGVVKHLKPEMAKKDVYTVIDQLAEEGLLSNPKELKELWKARKSIHIHLTGDVEEVNFSDENYILWHSALGKMIEDLNNNYNRKI